MYLVLRMANSKVKRKPQIMGRHRGNRSAIVDLLEGIVRPPRGQKPGVEPKRKGGRNRAPALNSGYTELDIFRMTSSPLPAPSPSALFALRRCALWRQPTGGALRGFRISMTGVNVRSSCSEPQSLPPAAEVHPPHVYVLASTVLVPHLVQSFTNSLDWGFSRC